MPRNPNKARCQHPGCRAWAVRNPAPSLDGPSPDGPDPSPDGRDPFPPRPNERFVLRGHETIRNLQRGGNLPVGG